MEHGVCRECGDTKRLADGVCAWRVGCEHRQVRHEAAMARLELEFQDREWERQALLHIRELYGLCVCGHLAQQHSDGAARCLHAIQVQVGAQRMNLPCACEEFTLWPVETWPG